ncbi:class I SAM-dependent DNA methyltransferase [Limosilactobacillus reuteri]|uniref:class I SAM-dependent DNA methyltransferase n=1 Tax=Limosilactobacillus reuteri TaxID=1598 RepID=UPI001E4A52CE|nr:DNA methyltransferase [Limosilactobacillus reuteri]MCC4347858.1 class I SAM-dependent DNA methyltransferase [Limosilactobacillus reuteri]MCC4374992.1 class I SAM-dependent DNA methyltransferase [Limosilactobacillus reuteri]MCC4385769.1 class I SAM-dependent DNA methyltransferase [Limosilactobacillus reuteri]
MAITEIEDHISNIITQDNHDQFIYDFLNVYDFPKATITKLRKGTNNLAKEPGEVYLKNRLYFKHTDTDLMQSFVDVKEKVNQLGSKPRYIMVTDFENVLAEDTKTGDTLDVEFERLPQKFEFFLAWNGIEKADFEKENPADIRAAERFAKLYDVVVKDNPDATRHGLNLFLIRILFCLFAEDTDIFEKNLFTNRLKELTKPDGSDLDSFMDKLFSVLDVENRLSDTPSWLADFPYVDGDLFVDAHEHLKFTAQSRKLIIDAGEKLEWDQINPDILGSMIQAVASEDSRSHLGMHYTSVPNIMKVIKPLFLDDLRQEFEKAKGNLTKLDDLYERIGKIKFMDPACGSGNFLIITYKELRQLEIDILKEQIRLDHSKMYLPSVTLDQFYGIEIDDFACDVTRLSLWIAEHQMNIKLRKEIDNAVRPTLPLQHAGAIVCRNALRIDWNEVLPHGKDDEVYLFGNPPYLGYSKQNKEQKADMKAVFERVIKKYKKLDYVCAWFQKGADFIKNISHTNGVGFVATNSISQGEQVSILWPKLLENIKIKFAYSSFKWGNNSKNNAGVMVVIIGMIDKNNTDLSKLYNDNNTYKLVNNITPYLTDGKNIVVKQSKKSLFGLPNMLFGSKPVDDGNLIFSENKYNQVIEKYPELRHYFKKYIGSNDLINSINRYALWLGKEQYHRLVHNPFIVDITDRVRTQRLKSKKKATRLMANKPYEFGENRYQEESAIIVPGVSSENRIYAPMSVEGKDTVISNAAFAIYKAPLWLLGLLESRMHMTWLRAVGGKLETRYRYSAILVYNTFPVPELSTRRKNEIEDLVWKILDIRDEEGGTLADLYGSPLAEKNPKPMNPRLLAAHQELDQVVDRAYRDRPFKDDNERLSLLLDMYSQKVNEAK